MISAANSTEYGLAAYVTAAMRSDAHEWPARLDAGMVGVNRGVISDVTAPLGGVKQSGIGREGGAGGMSEHQSVKYLALP